MPSGLHALRYVLVRGLRGMGQSPLVQLLAVGTMAVCLVLVGTATLIWLNVAEVADDWGIEVPITVYMAEEAAPGEAAALAEKVSQLPEVQSIEHVTPGDALARLEAGLGGQGSLLEGIDPETLPESLEITLHDRVAPEFAPALAEHLSQDDGVDEVATLGPWAGQARQLVSTLRLLALGVGLMVGAACVAIVWSTIRLGVFARREELEILRLVGGTRTFVRGPFLFEGFVQGALASVAALAMLYFGYDLLRPFLEGGLSLVFAAGAIQFFTPLQIGLAVVAGGALGVLGSRAAVARYVEA